jgi:surface protein
MDLDMSPVGSTRGMFMNCSSLKTVEGMSDWYMPNNRDLYYMFQKCGFETIDVSGWDCSSVQNMNGTFFSCKSLKSIEGLENWDTSKATTMRAMFEQCNALESLEGLGSFNTANVEDMAFMFDACFTLKNYDIGSWNTSNVKYFNSMFNDAGHNTGRMTVTYLPVENWDVSNAENMECMFYGCSKLLELDLSKWRPGKVTNFRHTFADCFSLRSIDLTGWTTESVTTFDGLFNDCYSLTELDLSDLDTGNCITFAQFFEGCGGLKTVKGMENWDVSKVVTMSEFFNANGKDMHLEYVNLSSFNTLSLKDVESLFNGCYRLKTVYVGDGWDTSKVTDIANMFAGCSSLVGGAGTVFRGSDLKYACVDGGETAPGYFTHINDRVTE